MATSSDFAELLDVTSDLVTFSDIPSSYKRESNIFVVYHLGEDFKASAKDWVGLFPSEWSDLSDYVAFRWSPKYPRDVKFPFIRGVEFPLGKLKVNTGRKDQYQWIYIAKGYHIAGVSEKFYFRDHEIVEIPPKSNLSDDWLLTIEPNLFTEQLIEKKVSDDWLTFIDPDALTCSIGSSQEESNNGEWLTMINADLLLEELDDNGLSIDQVEIKNEEKCENDSKKIINSHPYDIIKTEDHETLLGNFNGRKLTLQVVEPSENIKITDQLALVPFKERPLVPVFTMRKEKKLAEKFIESLLSNVQRRPPVITMDYPMFTCIPRALTLPKVEYPQTDFKPKTCNLCPKKDKQCKKLRSRCNKLKTQLVQARNALEDMEDKICMKDMVLEEMTKQLKSLIKENSNLLAINEKLHRKEKTQEKLKILESAHEQLIHNNEDLRSELDKTTEERAELQQEWNLLNQQYKSLEAHLDNIMYTLASHGFTKIIDTTGNVIHLEEHKTGEKVDLGGWNIVSHKKHSQAPNLNETLVSLQTERNDLVTQLDQSRLENTKLREISKGQAKALEVLQNEIDNLQDQMKNFEKSEKTLQDELAKIKLERQNKKEVDRKNVVISSYADILKGETSKEVVDSEELHESKSEPKIDHNDELYNETLESLRQKYYALRSESGFSTELAAACEGLKDSILKSASAVLGFSCEKKKSGSSESNSEAEYHSANETKADQEPLDLSTKKNKTKYWVEEEHDSKPKKFTKPSFKKHSTYFKAKTVKQMPDVVPKKTVCKVKGVIQSSAENVGQSSPIVSVVQSSPPVAKISNLYPISSPCTPVNHPGAAQPIPVASSSSSSDDSMSPNIITEQPASASSSGKMKLKASKTKRPFIRIYRTPQGWKSKSHTQKQGSDVGVAKEPVRCPHCPIVFPASINRTVLQRHIDSHQYKA